MVIDFIHVPRHNIMEMDVVILWMFQTDNTFTIWM